jgi:hypothetical protein
MPVLRDPTPPATGSAIADTEGLGLTKRTSSNPRVGYKCGVELRPGRGKLRLALPLAMALSILAVSACSPTPSDQTSSSADMVYPASTPTPDVPAADAPAPDASIQSPLDVPADPTTLQIACPEAYIGPVGELDYSFGYQTYAVEPFRVRIDYGDGHVYQNTDRHLALVFSHTYRSPGRHVVTATLTDARGQTAKATCTAAWALPAAPVQAAPPGLPASGGGYAALCSDGTTTTSGGTQGACSWHGGLASGSGAGSGGLTGSGSTYVQPYVRSDGTHVRGYWRSSH